MDDLRHTARVLLRRNDVGLIDLWVLYWNHGGRCPPFEFDGFIYGVVPPSWFNKEAFEAAVRDLAVESVA
ncbi:hypothetical protein AB0284_17530 [Pseudarthrobacter phenanthrenivorans]|uniref:hypothetical protein n=1 Tax=Pseudarthrobacter phenanthrenivorans TaxID=361575 RepID=UPI0034508C57